MRTRRGDKDPLLNFWRGHASVISSRVYFWLRSVFASSKQSISVGTDFIQHDLKACSLSACKWNDSHSDRMSSNLIWGLLVRIICLKIPSWVQVWCGISVKLHTFNVKHFQYNFFSSVRVKFRNYSFSYSLTVEAKYLVIWKVHSNFRSVRRQLYNLMRGSRYQQNEPLLA